MSERFDLPGALNSPEGQQASSVPAVYSDYLRHPARALAYVTGPWPISRPQSDSRTRVSSSAIASSRQQSPHKHRGPCRVGALPSQVVG